MSLIELSFLAVRFFVSLAAFALVRTHWGMAAALVAAILTFVALGGVLIVLDKLPTKRRPRRPDCACGRYAGESYLAVKSPRGGAVWRCECGLRYRQEGDRFDLLERDAAKPYMRWDSKAKEWKTNAS